jgi:hypothetical protein
MVTGFERNLGKNRTMLEIKGMHHLCDPIDPFYSSKQFDIGSFGKQAQTSSVGVLLFSDHSYSASALITLVI